MAMSQWRLVILAGATIVVAQDPMTHKRECHSLVQ